MSQTNYGGKKTPFIFTISIFVFILFFSLKVLGIERRKDQFQKDFGYVIFPGAYSIPGIGSGGLLGVGVRNSFDSYTDVFGARFFGDVEGYSLGILDVHLLEKRVIIEGGTAHFDKFGIQTFRGRGMDTDQDDFFYAQGSNIDGNAGQILWTFFDRRFEIFVGMLQGRFQLDRLRDMEGKLITEIEEKRIQHRRGSLVGFNLDLTDDHTDPKVGFRYNLSRTETNRENRFSPAYYVIDSNATLYLPTGEISTLVFNYFYSIAHVTIKGETAPDQLKSRFGFNCDQIQASDEKAECQQTVEDYVSTKITENTYGTATTLGGQNRLRGFPQGRFKGAVSSFYGLEFRWNLTDEKTPFNILIANDIRLGHQIAFFAESGSVAEHPEDIGKNNRNSLGIGYRMALSSGAIIRFDYGVGNEGGQTTITINYPWGIL